jgi:hypothetical protein
MRENIQIVLIAFFVAILFYILLNAASLKADALIVCTIVFFGIALLQFAIQIKRLLGKR